MEGGCIMFGILFFFFFNDTATTEIYTTEDTLSLHDALPICHVRVSRRPDRLAAPLCGPRAVRSEEHTSELQLPSVISYAVFCLKKKKKKTYVLSRLGCSGNCKHVNIKYKI